MNKKGRLIRLTEEEFKEFRFKKIMKALNKSFPDYNICSAEEALSSKREKWEKFVREILRITVEVDAELDKACNVSEQGADFTNYDRKYF